MINISDVHYFIVLLFVLYNASNNFMLNQLMASSDSERLKNRKNVRSRIDNSHRKHQQQS